jgi:hypothetical protein
MATRKKIVLRRQRRSALNRRKRQTGKRIYRRKVMRGGEENQITYGDLKTLLNYKLPLGVEIPFFTSVKADLKTEANIDIDTQAETTPITIDTLSKQILPVFQAKIIEKLPEAKKEEVRPLLDQLFGLLTTPPKDENEMTDKLNELINQIVKLTPLPIPSSIITSASSSIIVPKLVKVVFAATTVTTSDEISSPAASLSASGGGTASAAAQPVDLS